MKDALVKITFDVSDQSDSGFVTERLWSKAIGDDIYVIDNSPFQAYGISLGDKILAKNENGELKFVNVVERGGHSTYRVRLPAGCDHNYFLQHWKKLEALGCTYEGASGEQKLYSIDVPTIGNVPEVYRVLQAGEEAGTWEFEEAHYFRPGKT
ncbi:MAG TPA: DUF4265 domain-containing protein [Rhizomicrobium sp.]